MIINTLFTKTILKKIQGIINNCFNSKNLADQTIKINVTASTCKKEENREKEREKRINEMQKYRFRLV